MAFTDTAKLSGAPKTYKVASTVRRYTLIDNGFEETKSGNFQLIRNLDANIEDKRGLKLKLTVSKDLKQLKISTTTKNGLQAINLYAKNNTEMAIEKLDFLLAGLVERGVLEEVE